jgi:uncharacterized protein
MDRIVSKKMPQIQALCETHKVKELYVFGSRGKNGHPTEDSDFDLLVEIDEDDPINRGRLFLNLYMELEKLFNSKVDLVTFTSIKNQFFLDYVETSKQLIYDGSKN